MFFVKKYGITQRNVWNDNCYIDFLKSNGVVTAEEILLDNKELREKFLEYIIE